MERPLTAATASTDEEERLPSLREELTLHPGPRGADGAPTWTLQDPATNRFFRVGWAEFEILARWGHGDAAAVADAVRAETPLNATPAQVQALARFLATESLVQVRGEAAVAAFARRQRARRPHWLSALLKNYLFVRIPLLRPDRFLALMAPWIGWVFTRGFAVAMAAITLLGLVLVSRQWDSFVHSYLHFFSIEGMVAAALALTGAKALHELGHAYTAHRFGCRVPSMGVAFLVLWPVLYTDTTEAWKLTSRRARLAIGAAGMAAELALAALAALLWSFLPDGPWRSACFVLASTTWVLTLAVNLNPFMRFDGYYLLSDIVGVPNLQDRAFALARWRLREALFGFRDPPPEAWSPTRRRLLVIYALATWVYRAVLFIGIALLVYHLFFKLLGLLLFALEIGWFILRPIGNELTVWARRHREVGMPRRSCVTLAVVAILIAAAAIPWRGVVEAGAVLRAERHVTLYAPRAARLEAMTAEPGRNVAVGEVLFRFASPDLEYRAAQAERTTAVLRWQLAFQALAPDRLNAPPVVWAELKRARAEAAAYAAERADLEVTAPFSGVVTQRADDFAPGVWVAEGEALAHLIAPESAVVEAYVTEGDLGRIREEREAVFVPDDLRQHKIELRVVRIDATSARTLSEPVLASIHGGPIAVRRDSSGALVPEVTVYRVLLVPLLPRLAPPLLTRGVVRFDAERQSLIDRLWRSVFAILIRESGF